MGDFLPKHPNVPNQPTKPPDFVSNVIGLPSPAIPIPNTGLTLPKSSHMPSNTHPRTKTLGVAADPSNGDPSTGLPSFDAPPLGDPYGESIAPQNHAPEVLQWGLARVPMLASSGTLAAMSPPLISDSPSSDALISSQLIAPRMAQNLPASTAQHAPPASPSGPSIRVGPAA
ncbi:hypothetical protein Adt_04423 [Abeliophyllum distichum]|uniref:Uncharacterized protein n=1 Tax=Abeliophyllum distichum TaxID=126358 RepID=A0ABD1W1R9_9LAMI